MKIIGFNITKIDAERKSAIKEKLEIKQNIDVKNIEKSEVNISNEESIKFDFKFSLQYNPNVAEILIEGSILALDDKQESKEILKQWKKKKFTHPVKLVIFNFILDKCNLKALQLEEELNLPKHIKLPRITPQPDTNSNQNNNPANYAG
jgi:hypothetical protein